MRNFVRMLFGGCWPGGHPDLLRERRKRKYLLVCPQCGYTKAWPKQKLKVRRTAIVVKAVFGAKKRA